MGTTGKMFAVISDIHANYEAARAVFEYLDDHDVDRVICLGDVVGYGPDPEECVDLVQRRCEVTLCGNHEFALIYGEEDFSAMASQAISHHRNRLMPRPNQDEATRKDRQRRWNFLKSLPYRYVEDNYLFVHGSPRNPRSEYLRKRDIVWRLNDKMERNFELVDMVCFVGHTHHAGVFVSDFTYHTPEELDYVYKPKPWLKTIVNVGSVGQPRDGDSRASFVTVDDEGEIHYHRVKYDVEATIEKIQQGGSLHPKNARRLREGE